MAYFPFFIEIENQHGVVIGGGNVALGKIKKLLPFGADLTVIAPEFCSGVSALGNASVIHLVHRDFIFSDISTEPFPAFVITATDNPELNKEIADFCKRNRIPVNSVDDRSNCSFIFPALVNEGALTIGISTGGASPVAARYLKKKIQDDLPEHFSELLKYLEELRPFSRTYFEDSTQRWYFFNKLFSFCLESGTWPVKDEVLNKIIRETRQEAAASKQNGMS